MPGGEHLLDPLSDRTDEVIAQHAGYTDKGDNEGDCRITSIAVAVGDQRHNCRVDRRNAEAGDGKQDSSGLSCQDRSEGADAREGREQNQRQCKTDLVRQRTEHKPGQREAEKERRQHAGSSRRFPAVGFFQEIDQPAANGQFRNDTEG
ncbi:hypothetical protein D3C87_1659950 [compost metagenome]